MSELVDAEPCDVLRGGDGPVYFLLGGQLYVVHEVLGRWIEADQGAARPPGVDAGSDKGLGSDRGTGSEKGAGATVPRPAEPPSGEYVPGASEPARAGGPPVADPPMVEHWLVTASVGRFGRPAVFRLQRRPAPPAKGPDTWTVRAERR